MRGRRHRFTRVRRSGCSPRTGRPARGCGCPGRGRAGSGECAEAAADAAVPERGAGVSGDARHPFDTRHDGLREAALFTRVRRPQLGFEQIRGQQDRKRTQPAPQCGTARLAKGDCYQCGGIDAGNGHSFRSARNRSSAPGRSITGAGGFHALPERTSAPRRSSSSSRSSIVSELRGTGRISATGSPRRDTVTVFPARTGRMTSEKRALASCRILEVHAEKPCQSHKSGQARDGGGWIERPGASPSHRLDHVGLGQAEVGEHGALPPRESRLNQPTLNISSWWPGEANGRDAAGQGRLSAWYRLCLPQPPPPARSGVARSPAGRPPER